MFVWRRSSSLKDYGREKREMGKFGNLKVEWVDGGPVNEKSMRRESISM